MAVYCSANCRQSEENIHERIGECDVFQRAGQFSLFIDDQVRLILRLVLKLHTTEVMNDCMLLSIVVCMNEMVLFFPARRSE